MPDPEDLMKAIQIILFIILGGYVIIQVIKALNIL
jgi:hypothetical protein